MGLVTLLGLLSAMFGMSLMGSDADTQPVADKEDASLHVSHRTYG